jgi:hypothetical protein
MPGSLVVTREYTDVLGSGAGSARVTRQYVDILFHPPGPTRVTREYVEVLSKDLSAITYDIQIIHHIDFISDATEVFGTIIETVENVLEFEYGSYPGLLSEATCTVVQYDFTVEHTLDLVDVMGQSTVVETELDLIQNIKTGYGATIEHELGFVQSVIALGIFPLTIEHALGLQQSCTIYSESDKKLGKQYHPFLGFGSTDNPTPPNSILTGTNLTVTAPFQFVWPSTGTVTDWITLRAPEFGNKDKLTFNRVNRETRGGSLIVYANPMWPKTQTLALTFTGLKQTEVQDLLDFLNDHLGVEIGLIDWETRYWRGIITTTTNPVIEDSFDNYTVNLEFEGELILNWTPQILAIPSGLPCRIRE